MKQKKRLIVCYDGTWNTADNKGLPTNVVRFARMITPTASDGTSQIVYYDLGVGTGNFLDRIAGGALGRGLEQKIKDGYLFLAHNYEPGDEIYIFGFSRGAFTARSLGGFIGACGGLLFGEQGLNKLGDAWTYYRAPPAKRTQYSFRLEISNLVNRDVTIDCLGVWDTVGALGIPGNLFNQYNRQRYSFHDTRLSGLVKHAFQALAIDEKRGPFEASLWQKPKEPVVGQLVEQVWFPGVHANIGGGYRNTNISDLALRWMMARVMIHCGLQFDPKEVAYFLPELADPANVRGSVEAAVKHIGEKYKGELYDSLSWYLGSRLSPRLRAIGNQSARRGNGPIKTMFRTSARSPRGVFEEAVHWSVMQRHKNSRTDELPQYDPPNLRVVRDQIRKGTMPVVSITDEVKPGKPYAVPVQATVD